MGNNNRKNPEERKPNEEPERRTVSGLPDELELTGDEELLERLRLGLDSLDRSFPVQQPDPEWLALRLTEHAQIIRKCLIRDIMLFVAVALLILAVMAGILLKLPVLFIAIQVLSGLVIPAALLVRLQWRRVKNG